jgi:trehalose 6-phosphate synthase
MKQRVLVASNRGPVSYQFGTDGSLTGRRGGGGMIAGVICAALSDADRAAARQHGTGSRDEDGVPVRMLDIPPDTFDRAYNNVANSTLWFLHHLLFDTPVQPQFGHEFDRDWAAYLAYNQAFAEALAQEALAARELAGQELADRAPGGVRVLIQDYHLSLAPRLLRDKLGGAHGV